MTTVPGDGTRLRLLVALRATGHNEVRVPLAYALTLKARAGRWEIASLDGAPAPATPATPAGVSAPPPTADLTTTGPASADRATTAATPGSRP
ncbi:hypothetical protein [Streptomyces sp. NPDC056632]|uniref:hypothetical protein n=1 Tax=Streptomyces sp. NPDC056632 TaxID=3345884 RepID=UPI0036CDA6EC